MLKLLESGDHGLDLGAPVIRMLCERHRWKCSPRTVSSSCHGLLPASSAAGSASWAKGGMADMAAAFWRARATFEFIDSQSCLAFENGVKVVLTYFASARCWCRPGSSARTRPVMFASAWPRPMT